MKARARSHPPQWLIVFIVVIGCLAIGAAALKYVIGDGDGRSSRAGGGSAGHALTKATIAGSARSVQTAGVVRLSTLSLDTGLRRWTVRIDDRAIDGTGPVTIQGEGITADLFRTLVALDHVEFASRTGRVALPDRVTVNGESVQGSRLELELLPGEGAVRWLDPPASMTLESVDEFSWAGSGEIAVAAQKLTSEFLGAMGSLQVTLTRTAEAIQVTATGGVQQVFIDGQPALKTTGAIDRIRSDVTVAAGAPNDKSFITWTPRDTGSFALCVLRITPRSGHAEWINVGLQHMPPMFGGEQHAPVGGDTAGLGDNGRFFGGADAIDSFIRVGTADRRDLSINVPAGTPPGKYPIEIAIEGNFEPVVFSMTITVPG